MDNVLSQLPPGGRVAVIRLRSLGDCVLTTPALHLLKSARPDLKIAVVVETRFAPVFEANPDIHAILPPEVAPLRAFQPDLCLNLHGGGTSARLTVLSRARHRAGFDHFRHRVIYTIQLPTAQQTLGVDRKVHTAEHLASAVFALGVPMAEIPRALLFADLPPVSGPGYAVIHPLASEASKTWDAGRFLAVAEHLRGSLDLEPVFIGGPGEDLAPFRRWTALGGHPLAQVKSLLKGATLFLGNDSGPAHMAAAFGVPSVVLFASSDPVVWAPWRTPAEVLIAQESMDSLSVAQVIDALDRMRVPA